MINLLVRADQLNRNVRRVIKRKYDPADPKTKELRKDLLAYFNSHATRVTR